MVLKKLEYQQMKTRPEYLHILLVFISLCPLAQNKCQEQNLARKVAYTSTALD